MNPALHTISAPCLLQQSQLRGSGTLLSSSLPPPLPSSPLFNSSPSPIHTPQWLPVATRLTTEISAQPIPVLPASWHCPLCVPGCSHDGELTISTTCPPLNFCHGSFCPALFDLSPSVFADQGGLMSPPVGSPPAPPCLPVSCELHGMIAIWKGSVPPWVGAGSSACGPSAWHAVGALCTPVILNVIPGQRHRNELKTASPSVLLSSAGFRWRGQGRAGPLAREVGGGASCPETPLILRPCITLANAGGLCA